MKLYMRNHHREMRRKEIVEGEYKNMAAKKCYKQIGRLFVFIYLQKRVLIPKQL